MDAFDQQEATRVAREVKREGPRVLLLFLSQSILDADCRMGSRWQFGKTAW